MKKKLKKKNKEETYWIWESDTLITEQRNGERGMQKKKIVLKQLYFIRNWSSSTKAIDYIIIMVNDVVFVF